MRSLKSYEWAIQWPECENWLGSMAEVTKREYAKDLQRFCLWSKLGPRELLMFKKNKDSLEAEKLLDRFVAVAPFTDSIKERTVAAIRSFYSANYKDLAKRAGRITAAKQKPYRTPSPEELQEFIQGAWHIRNRALVAFIAATGMRAGTVVSMTWRDVNLDEEIPHISVMGKRLKGKGKRGYGRIEQHTFLTPEAKRLLQQYWDWRVNIKKEKLTKKSFLFADVREPFSNISTANMRKIFLQISERTGITFSPHDLRRYTQTQLEEAKLSPNWIHKILGKKIRGEETPYSRPKIEQLRKAYREAIPHLIFIDRERIPTLTPTETEELKAALEVLKKALGVKSFSIENAEELARKLGLGKEQKTETNGNFIV